MFEMLSDFARDFSQIDSNSMTVLIVMVGWATLLVNVGVDSKSFTAIFVPGMFLGGMAAFYLTRLAMISISASKDINAIMISVAGIVAGFLLTLMLLQLYHWVLDQRRALTMDERD
jgi:hypothetical protein